MFSGARSGSCRSEESMFKVRCQTMNMSMLISWYIGCRYCCLTVYSTVNVSSPSPSPSPSPCLSFICQRAMPADVVNLDDRFFTMWKPVNVVIICYFLALRCSGLSGPLSVQSCTVSMLWCLPLEQYLLTEKSPMRWVTSWGVCRVMFLCRTQLVMLIASHVLMPSHRCAYWRQNTHMCSGCFQNYHNSDYIQRSVIKIYNWLWVIFLHLAIQILLQMLGALQLLGQIEGFKDIVSKQVKALLTIWLCKLREPVSSSLCRIAVAFLWTTSLCPNKLSWSGQNKGLEECLWRLQYGFHVLFLALRCAQLSRFGSFV